MKTLCPSLLSVRCNTHCNTLQHTATHTTTHCKSEGIFSALALGELQHTLQHTAIALQHTLQHTAREKARSLPLLLVRRNTHCNTLQLCCNTHYKHCKSEGFLSALALGVLQHTLQHTAIVLQHTLQYTVRVKALCPNLLLVCTTATHCNTL